MEIIRSVREFEALRTQWNLLAEKLKNPLLLYEWFFYCAKTFQPDGTLRICIIRENGKLNAAAPLVATQTGIRKRWELLGVSQLYEPCGFLYDSFESLSALIQGLLCQGFPLVLQRVGMDLEEALSSKKIPFNKGFMLTRATSPSLSLRLPNSYNQLLAERSAKFRNDLKRKLTRAKAMGSYGVEFIDPSPNELSRLLQILFEVEGSGWKGANSSSLKSKPFLGKFFKHYSLLAAKKGLLRLALLRIDNQVAAIQLSIEYFKRLWVLKIGYDEAYSNISPGYLLTAETIRNAIERQLDRYEFLGVAEPWQERWGSERRSYYLIMVYPASVRGALSFLIDGAESAKKLISSRIKNFSTICPQE
jgi:CelD/BcsL family acetyltransferase involved in cellulose biosynthesis